MTTCNLSLERAVGSTSKNPSVAFTALIESVRKKYTVILRDGEKRVAKSSIYLCQNSQNINGKEYLQSKKVHRWKTYS